MDRLQVRNVLGELNFAEALPEATLAQLAQAFVVREYAAGAVLFTEDHENHNFYLLIDGLVQLEMNVPGRGKTAILSIGPGDMFGWSALLGHGRMTTTAVAMQDSRVVAASGKRLLDVCNSDHEIGFQFMSRLADSLARRLTATRLQLLDLFSQTPPQGK